MHARPAALLLGLTLATTLPAQELLYRLDGLAAGDEYGAALALLGDLDGDGVPEILAGGRKHTLNGLDSGMVRVTSGADGSEIFTLYGLAPREGFGIAVDGLGDVDGDGLDDFAVGVVGEMSNGFQSGAVRVFSGADAHRIREHQGEAGFWFLGISVACAGDVDADGVPDLLAGAYRAPVAGPDTGLARVWSGADGSLLHEVQGATAFDLFGQAVSDCGDLNGDGHGEFAAAAPFHDGGAPDGGQVQVFDGATGSVLYTWLGTDPGGNFGYAVETVGDADGDGVPDLAVGANRDSRDGFQTGRVFLYSGATGLLLWERAGGGLDERLGESVSAAGDLDGDGLADLVAGGPESDRAASRAGLVRLLSGLDGAELGSLDGPGAEDLYGTWVAGGADLDGDGRPDLAVGAPWEDFPGPQAGSVYVHRLVLDGPRLLDPVPGTAGTLNSFPVEGATPGAPVDYAWSLAAGTSPGPCPGLSWDLSAARPGGNATADAAGRAVLTATVPAAAAGRALLLQAADLLACRPTPVLAWTF